MQETLVPTTREKTLSLNLNPHLYGSFAEIGAGQEVARLFFQAGAASGTIARAISAYDMQFSDDLYGRIPGKRYVSKPRLEKMLDTEFNLLNSILGQTRGTDSSFFAFANTVATINFNKDNQGHGWLGVQYQLQAGTAPNKVVMHVNLHERDVLLQQRTLGVLGLNLIYACYNHHRIPMDFIRSLTDNLNTDQFEITMLEMTGPDLDYVDNRLLAVQLVKTGMTNAALFDRYGKIQQPADMLYRKNVLAIRGSFRPITFVGFDMLKTSYALFKNDTPYSRQESVVLCEITLNNLLQNGDFDERDFLDRVDLLCGMGQNVMISSFREFYKLTHYLSNFRINELRLVMGVLTFRNLLDDRYYADLKGGTLEAFGMLFLKNMKLYLYPALQPNTQRLLSIENLPIPDDVSLLVKHLRYTGKILDIRGAKKEWLHIFSYMVLERIRKGNPEWTEMVPRYVSESIIKRKLFGFKGFDERILPSGGLFEKPCGSS